VAGERSKTLGHVLPDSLRNCALQFDRVGFDLMLERHIKCALLPCAILTAPLPSMSESPAHMNDVQEGVELLGAPFMYFAVAFSRDMCSPESTPGTITSQ